MSPGQGGRAAGGLPTADGLERWLGRAHALGGGLALALGAIVLLAWHAGWAFVLQVRADYTPMVYNTALCLVLGGAALFALARGRGALALPLGGLVAALGAVNALEQLLALDLGVDRLWMEPYITVATPHPGRMAPNTALCFLCLGLALAASALRRSRPWREAFAGFLGMAALGIAANGFSGYFTGIRSAYGWGAIPMAIHTTLGVGALGCGVVAHAWRVGRRRSGRSPRWLGLSIGVPAATATYWHWHAATVHDSALPGVLLVTGLLNSLLLSLAVYLAQRSRQKEGEARLAYHALDGESREREHAQAALRSSEQRLAGVIETVAEGLFLVDREGRITYANARAEELVGLRRDVIQQRHYADAAWKITDGEGRPVPAEELPVALALARCQPVFEVELSIERPDGKRVAISVNAAPLIEVDGGVAGVIASVSDVTRRKEVEHLKDAFVSTVSHELRTPLASLRGFAELMLEREFSPEKRREFLRIIHAESIRLGALVDDFLDIQRLESGRAVYDFRSLELAPMLEDTRALFASGKHVLRLSVPPRLPAVRADSDRLRQVLTNLVSNAQKFSPPGSEIALEARCAGDEVIVSVVDHGVGIDAETLPRLFEKFFRADNPETRNTGGTGLGLALVKEIVEAHGGRVWVESERGRGSRFHFSLPLASTPLPPASGPHDPSASTDVLLVEDDESFARLLAERAVAEGLHVSVCPSGERALEQLQRFPARLIVLDLQLAGTLDGWDVLSSVKSDASLRRLPVLMLSGSEAIDQRGLALAGAEYMPKPITPDWLRHSVERRLPGGGRGQVLVVDDDPAFRLQAIEALAPLDGIEVTTASSATEALERIGEHMPDLLVLDLLMPEVDGFEVLRRLRRDRRAANLGVLVVTGKELSAQDKARLRGRMATLVRKQEASLEQVLQTMRQLLGPHQDPDLLAA